ncbi:hypothetical protein BDR05DRAFT_957782 [Suillus weaverae]|nr:hypothetical protein BDR05DRAFT_957782 [Suillus weaverae]
MCWWDGEYGLYCDVLFVGSKLSAHLREAHGIHGSDKSLVCCRWRSCNRQFNKESLARHVEEVHMEIVYKCGCGSAYSRKDTLNRHQKNCSGQR